MQGQHREDGLNATRAAQQVTGHGLCGTDHQAFGVVAKCGLYGVSFIQVTERGRRTVGVQIADLIGINTCIFQGHDHGAAWAVNIRRCHVISVSTHAKTGDFSVNSCAARLGVFVLFQHDNPSAFAEHKTIAVFIPGA